VVLVSFGVERPEGPGEWREVPGREAIVAGERFILAPYWVRPILPDEAAAVGSSR
jgi:hypothetical protein